MSLAFSQASSACCVEVRQSRAAAPLLVKSRLRCRQLIAFRCYSRTYVLSAAGSEAVGTVEELGPGTSGRLSKGQRVVSADWGLASWQQYVAVKEDFLVNVTLRLNFPVVHAHISAVAAPSTSTPQLHPERSTSTWHSLRRPWHSLL